MPWRTRQHFPALKIAIVGGGVASFVAGITLRERLPNAEITLYCAAGETMIGGQLASWDEQGYPIEHGLHALFGFYDHILPILKKIGAYENLTRSKEHIFIRERGAIHRFDLRNWPATYRGFTVAEKNSLSSRRSRDLQAFARCKAKWHRRVGCLRSVRSAGARVQAWGARVGPAKWVFSGQFYESCIQCTVRAIISGRARVGLQDIFQEVALLLQLADEAEHRRPAAAAFHRCLSRQHRVQPEAHQGSHRRSRRSGGGARFS